MATMTTFPQRTLYGRPENGHSSLLPFLPRFFAACTSTFLSTSILVEVCLVPYFCFCQAPSPHNIPFNCQNAILQFKIPQFLHQSKSCIIRIVLDSINAWQLLNWNEMKSSDWYKSWTTEQNRKEKHKLWQNFAEQRSFNLCTCKAKRRYIKRETDLPTYDKSFQFQVLEGIWLCQST